MTCATSKNAKDYKTTVYIELLYIQKVNVAAWHVVSVAIIVTRSTYQISLALVVIFLLFTSLHTVIDLV